jgi:lipid II:glycine glycyltransferase (peptidoglycan interpeptide bridge formation enzyme)
LFLFFFLPPPPPPPPCSGLDIIHEFQYSKKRLFSNFAKNTKYEINRALNKDNIIIETPDPLKNKEFFYLFYNEFAKLKRRRPIDKNQIDLLIDNNMFVIRTASYNSEVLVIHTYVTGNNRARLMHSASLFRAYDDNLHRNLIGRANRLLHWEDIKYFKNLKYAIYDFGGIDLDSSNSETRTINEFKKGFGGRIVKEYKSFVPVTMKGFIYLFYKKILGKL